MDASEDRRLTGIPRGRWGLPVAIGLALLAAPLAMPAALAQDAERSHAASASPSLSDGRVLEPGRHAWESVGPSISMEVGEGWRERERIDGPILTFERGDMPGGVLTVTRFDGDAFADPCDPTTLTFVEPSAERLVEIIRGNPFLEAEDPEPMEVGGLPALSLDAITPPFAPVECRLGFLLIWAIPMENGEFVQVPGQAARFVAVDVGTDTVVFAIETLPGMAFEPFAHEAMELLATVSFESA